MKRAKLFTSVKGVEEMMRQQDGLMFDQTEGRGDRQLNIYPERCYQEILGFGAAFTETSAYNYAKMSSKGKEKVIEALFDKEKGLGLNYCRTHIHSCDFALNRYTYVREQDEKLESFSISRDQKYIIPFIKAAQNTAEGLELFASPWTPPSWMKDNNEMIHGGRLLEAYYQSWADYMVRYVTEYAKEGIRFSGISVQNEAMAFQTWESCQYTAEEEAVFVHKYLWPALRKAGFDDIGIMVWDHNRERVYDRARDSFAVPGAREDIWGVAYHWYSGDHYAALDMVHEAFPEKALILSEISLGGQRGETAQGAHSSFIGLEIWVNELIENFNHHMNAFVAWNMIVDENGGPYHDRPGGCKAPIVADDQTDTFILEPIYYAIAHFSRFIKRGAVRLGTSVFKEEVKMAAFQNPDGEIVSVILNRTDRVQEVWVRLEGRYMKLMLPADSVTTCVITEE